MSARSSGQIIEATASVAEGKRLPNAGKAGPAIWVSHIIGAMQFVHTAETVFEEGPSQSVNKRRAEFRLMLAREGWQMLLRQLRRADVPGVMVIQRDAYMSELVESEETFVRKLDRFASGCLGLFEGNQLVAYVFAHPWSGDDVVPLNAESLELPDRPVCLYVHDLAVLRTFRGRGAAKILIDHLFVLSDHLGVRRLSLVAVQSSEPFWGRYGFVVRDSLMYAPNILGTHMVCERQDLC